MTDVVKKKDGSLTFDGLLPFGMRFARVAANMRTKAKDFLKFDSEVSNISYVYVDTQQYKELLGACCDAEGVAFTCTVSEEEVQAQQDKQGRMVYIAHARMTGTFFDPYGEKETYDMSAVGLGVSTGSGYALGIAQTNAMRNMITNGFLLPTSDRESDDVRENIKPSEYLTDEAKAEKRAELLEKTKTSTEFSTVAYGMILKTRIEDALANKTLDDAYRATLETFLKEKYSGGQPIPREEDADLWIVKRTAAMQIMSDLDSI